MSFLIRMAQTRPGAERLLEARIFPVLSQCEFLDTRPEADQSFMGTWAISLRMSLRAEFILLRPGLFLTFGDSAIPSAVHAGTSARCCDVDDIRSSACYCEQSGRTDLWMLSGGWTLTLTCLQALDFLSSHRETIIILLKNDSEEIGLSIVQEIHLVVSLSRSVLTLVPKSELVSHRLCIRFTINDLCCRCRRILGLVVFTAQC